MLVFAGSLLQYEWQRVKVQGETIRLILYVALIHFLLVRRKRQLELSDDHCDDHAKLHHRQRLASAAISAVRERHKCISTNDKVRLRGPAFGYEFVRSNE